MAEISVVMIQSLGISGLDPLAFHAIIGKSFAEFVSESTLCMQCMQPRSRYPKLCSPKDEYDTLRIASPYFGATLKGSIDCLITHRYCMSAQLLS